MGTLLAMDEWFNIVVRQMMLYSLPLLVSLALVGLFEAKLSGIKMAHPFYAVAWRGCWLPFVAALFLHRGVIIALPQPLSSGVKAAAIRLLAHLFLCGLGFLLYAWSLSHQTPAGLPPLHYWWAKVLMFFNLCMAMLHILPLPMLLMGELFSGHFMLRKVPKGESLSWVVLTLLVATPLLDISLGTLVIYPVYEWLSNLAAYFASRS